MKNLEGITGFEELTEDEMSRVEGGLILDLLAGILGLVFAPFTQLPSNFSSNPLPNQLSSSIRSRIGDYIRR